MAGEFPVNDPNAVKIWSKHVEVAEREFLEIAPLIGDSNSIIWEKSELTKGPGDEVKFNLRAVLFGAGFSEGETAEGNGETLAFGQDAVRINELGHTIVTPSENTIDAQRVPFELRKEGRDGLTEWWGNRKGLSFFNHVCGFTPANTVSATSGPKFTGLNAVTAPAGIAGQLIRQIWAGAATNDQGLTSNDIMTTQLIDKARTRAVFGHQGLRPVMVGGKKKWVLYLSPVQVEQLRTNTGAGGWLDIQKAALAGAGKHGIYDGALGEWNNVVLRESQQVTYGVNSGTGAVINTVRRAVLLGRGAAVCAYGRKTNPAKAKYRWSEELKDHGRKLEVGAWGMWGVKKAVFQTPNPVTQTMVPVDFGSLVISTHAPDPA